MINLTTEQWNKIEKKVKMMVETDLEGYSVPLKGEIHKQEDRFEQREYAGNYYRLISEISDIIEQVLVDDGTFTEEEAYDQNFQQVEGFYDLVSEVEGFYSDKLPEEFYCYFSDGDIWVARHWDNEEEIPEDLKNLVDYGF